jgi:hypothetical protein
MVAYRMPVDDLSGWGGDGEDDHEATQHGNRSDEPPYPHWLVAHDTLVLIGGNLVLLLWVASGIIGAVLGDYTLMQLVTPVMLAYAGYLFGKPFVKAKSA